MSKFILFQIAFFSSLCLGEIKPTNSGADTIRILSIDGGGIRGIIPASVLKEIESRTNKPITDLFDFIVGVSTGGILAFGLNVPNEQGNPKYSASDLVDLYSKHAEDIFPGYSYDKSLFHSVSSAQYPIAGMQKVLKKYFGDTRLSQSIMPSLALAYNMNTATPYYLCSIYAKEDQKYDFFMKFAAQATAHAQTYFDINPITNIKNDQFLFLDGGNADNNPSLVAINFAKDHFPFSKVFLVSLGTGDIRTPIDIKKHGWHGFFTGGVGAWGQDTVNMLMSSTSEHVHRRVERYLNNEKNGNYFRFNPIIEDPEQKDLDNSKPDNLMKLKVIAESIYTVRRYETFWHLLG